MEYFYESQKERAEKALNDLKDTNEELDRTEKINNTKKEIKETLKRMAITCATLVAITVMIRAMQSLFNKRKDAKRAQNLSLADIRKCEERIRNAKQEMNKLKNDTESLSRDLISLDPYDIKYNEKYDIAVKNIFSNTHSFVNVEKDAANASKEAMKIYRSLEHEYGKNSPEIKSLGNVSLLSWHNELL